MHVDALLCDAATVREGLIHILGGGITRIHRPAYPAPLGVAVALLLTLQRSEVTERHRLRLNIVNEDGKQVAQLDGEFGIEPGPDVRPGEQVAMPLILNLGGIAIPKAGSYSMDLLVDSQLARSLPFYAEILKTPA